MATLETPPIPVGPKSPVPLDTIPISPANGNDSAGSSDEKLTSQTNGASQPKRPADGQITVFHDPENFNVKHPLMHEWTLWFTKPATSKVSCITLLLNGNH